MECSTLSVAVASAVAAVPNTDTMAPSKSPVSPASSMAITLAISSSRVGIVSTLLGGWCYCSIEHLHLGVTAMRLILALCLASVFTPLAYAQSAPVVLEARDCVLIAGLGASADRASTPVPVARYGRASFYVQWAALTGTLDGAVKVQVASSSGPPTSGQWVDKTAANFVISSANGAESISITNLTEAWARLVYTHNNVAGGTVTANCNAKGI